MQGSRAAVTYVTYEGVAKMLRYTGLFAALEQLMVSLTPEDDRS